MSQDRPLNPVCDGGRDPATGQFKRGNCASRGNGIARKAAQFRTKLFDAVTIADFQAVVRRLVIEAKGGESWAVKLLLQYLLGEPIPHDVTQEIENLRIEIERINRESPN